MSSAVITANMRVPAPAPRAQADTGESPLSVWGRDGFGFDDLLDIVNPLQHIPIINAVYRKITGDEIGDAAKAAGGALFGGVPGLVASLADTVVKEITGNDLNGHLASVLVIEEAAPVTGIAKAAPAESGGAPGASSVSTGDGKSAPYPAPTGERPFAALPTGIRPAGAVRPHGVLGTRNPATARGGEAAPATAASRRSAAALRNLPPPEALARNPQLVHKVRKGESAFFRPGGAISSDAWLRLIAGTGAKPDGATRSRGAKALATGTIAKAVASYGRAGALAATQAQPDAVPKVLPRGMAVPQAMAGPSPVPPSPAPPSPVPGR